MILPLFSSPEIRVSVEMTAVLSPGSAWESWVGWPQRAGNRLLKDFPSLPFYLSHFPACAQNSRHAALVVMTKHCPSSDREFNNTSSRCKSTLTDISMFGLKYRDGRTNYRRSGLLTSPGILLRSPLHHHRHSRS